MSTRRRFLQQSAGLSLALTLPGCITSPQSGRPQGILVNDVQSQLNPTRVRRIVQPTTVDDLAAALRRARREQCPVSIAGGRHAMGGQQFGSDALLLDMTQFNRVVNLDTTRGLVEAEAGIEWPDLIAHLNRVQAGKAKQWTIREKQSGVDRVSLGGSLAANVHGRGLQSPPFVNDIESFRIMNAKGDVLTCSRTENAQLFALAIGGYGLFGVVTHVTLRLTPRIKLQRVVEVIPVQDLLPWVDRRIREGFIYGDCQYSTDLTVEAEAHPGVFACYRPVDDNTPVMEQIDELSEDDWVRLYRLARTDKKRAFDEYSQYYLRSSGQTYWSDTHQLAGNFDSYRKAVDPTRGTEVITEIYVRPEVFVPFMGQVRQDFIDHDVDMTYGTIRFIERDTETFLPWAREKFVCIICNLHVVHTDAGKQKAAADFRRMIDRAIEYGGSYYLTYHRWAQRRQVEACHPRFVEFLKLKRRYDPQELFQSDWYRHYREMFADVLA